MKTKNSKKKNKESLEDIAKKPLNIGIFVRAFDKNEKNTISISEQQTRCEIAVKSRNWNVAKVYQGTDSNDSDHAYNEMMSDLKEKIIDGITVFKIDRLYRKNQDFLEILQMFKEFEQEKHIFFSAFDSLDNTTPTGVLFLNIQISHDVYEKELRDECATSLGFDESKYTARQNEDIENNYRLADEYDNPHYLMIAGIMRIMQSYKKVPLTSTKPVDFLFP